MKVIHFEEGLLLTEYLQKEQDLVREVKEPTLFTWIVRPTVIYGRHQQAEVEVNERYCREHGIRVVQRKSGGGCVYADEGNLMISYIEPSDFSRRFSESPFTRFLNSVAQILQAYGVPAVTTAHNDILVGDRKVSGWACYTAPTGTIVHGTMLYNVDLEAMRQAITPTEQKLQKHGVASVRQRVQNLCSLTDAFPDIQTLRQAIEQAYATK
ncbi:MAG: lipoate--protein ligase family protein [Paludibacteraceae bacterium]|nr:lipoate--protein ligase family protein [Paludibacteraceae bacterium]